MVAVLIALVGRVVWFDVSAVSIQVVVSYSIKGKVFENVIQHNQATVSLLDLFNLTNLFRVLSNYEVVQNFCVSCQ